MGDASNMLLTKLWSEIEKPIKESPSLYTLNVLRLDENALVLETHAQEGGMIGLGLFVMCLAIAFIPAMFWVSRDDFLNTKVIGAMHGGEWFLYWVILIFETVTGLAAAFGLAPYLLYRGLIQSAPSPIICDRRAGKIYGSHKGKPVELDWKQVKLVLTQGILLAGGVQRFYNLVFFQPEKPETWSGKGNHRGTGIVVTAGQPWGWQLCGAIAEFIRCYMEEPPKDAAARLPAVAPGPKEAGWVTRWLDRGPYNEFTEVDGRMERLRERNGWPELGIWRLLFLTAQAPAFGINLLQVHVRRVVQLPAAWWPKLAEGPNPYNVVEARPGDVELRRTAAKRVMVLLLSCISIGCACWAWVFVVAIRNL